MVLDKVNKKLLNSNYPRIYINDLMEFFYGKERTLHL